MAKEAFNQPAPQMPSDPLAGLSMHAYESRLAAATFISGLDATQKALVLVPYAPALGSPAWLVVLQETGIL